VTAADLRAWRAALGWSRRAAAAALGLSASSYAGLERDRPLTCQTTLLARYVARFGPLDPPLPPARRGRPRAASPGRGSRGPRSSIP